MKRIIILIIAFALVFIIAGCKTDTTPPTLSGITDETIAYEEDFDLLEGVTADDDIDGDITDNITYVVTNLNGDIATFDTSVSGSYIITYLVKDEEGNEATDERTITVSAYVDITAPVIDGAANISITTVTEYDPISGVTAVDNVDGDVTSLIEYTIYDPDDFEVDDIDGATIGIFTVVYVVSDSSLNESTLTIYITVVDEVLPVLVAEDYTINNTLAIDVMNGVLATDNIDGDITDLITTIIYDPDDNVVANIDGDILGVFTVVHTVSDLSLNETTLTVYITVIDELPPVLIAVNITTNNGSPFDVMSEVTALDNTDGDITNLITYEIRDFDNNLVTEIGVVAGIYVITYTVTDSSSNTTTEVISVIISDIIDPIFNGIDDIPTEVVYGDVVDISGFVTAIDETDGDITDLIDLVILDGELEETTFDTSIPGIYSFIFTITDLAGNEVTEIIFVTVGDSEPIGVFVDLTTAQELFTEFYSDVFDGVLTVEEVCDKYIGDIPFAVDPLYDDCIEGLPDIIVMFESFVVDNVVYDDTFGHLFYGTLTLTDFDSNEVTMEIEFEFLALEYSEDYYINFTDSPFVFLPPIIELPIPETTVLLDTYYTDLLDDTYPVEDFCNNYVLPLINNVATLEQCVIDVNNIRSMGLTHVINSVEITVVQPPDSDPFNGYIANITLTDFEGDHIFDLTFALYDNDGEPMILLFGSPLGDDNGGPEIADLTVEEATPLIEAYYEDLLDETITNTDFCEMYFMLGTDMSPMNLLDCEAFRTDVLASPYTFTVGSVVLYPPSDDGPPYFLADMTRFDGVDTITYQAMFIFILDENSNVMLAAMFDNTVNGGDIGGGGPQIADVTLGEAEILIDQYYLDLVDETILNDDFCGALMLLATDMEQLDVTACGSIRDDILTDNRTYILVELVFVPAGDDNPDYFTAYVESYDGSEYRYFYTNFYFVLNEAELPMIGVQFYESVGDYIQPMQPVAVIVTEAYALAEITSFYEDLFDTSISTEDFCLNYYSVNPYSNPNDCINRDYFLSLDIFNDYSIEAVLLETYPDELQYQVWEISLTEVSPDATISVVIRFEFVVGLVDMLTTLNVIDPPLGPDPYIQMPPLDETIAYNLITDYYEDLFDIVILDLDFCNTWVINNPFYTGTEQDCLDGRDYALSRSETYTVNDVILDSTYPFIVYVATIYVEDGLDNITYEMHFFITTDGIDTFITFMDEMIRDVTP